MSIKTQKQLLFIIFTMLILMLFHMVSSFLEKQNPPIADMTEEFNYSKAAEGFDRFYEQNRSFIFIEHNEKDLFIDTLKNNRKIYFEKEAKCKKSGFTIKSEDTQKLACLEGKEDAFHFHNAKLIAQECPEMTISYNDENKFDITNIKASMSEKYPNDILDCAYSLINLVVYEYKLDWRYVLEDRTDKFINWAHYKSEKQMQGN